MERGAFCAVVRGPAIVTNWSLPTVIFIIRVNISIQTGFGAPGLPRSSRAVRDEDSSAHGKKYSMSKRENMINKVNK